MNTLLAKLSIAMIVIVCGTGAGFYATERINARAFYEEIWQRLNAPVAKYVARRRQLIDHGRPDGTSIRFLARLAGFLKPTAEIFLIDPHGEIISHSLAEDPAATQVDLGPVLAFLAPGAHLPIRGDSPSDPGTRRVFSAAEIRSDAGLEGYLYVVLDGAGFDEFASGTGESYVRTSSSAAVAAIAGSTAMVGLLVFVLLTRRLKRLNREFERVSGSGFELPPALKRPRRGGDEIDALDAAFLDMAARIRIQIVQLKEVDHLRRELVSNISHDLRTPLSAAQGYIETLVVKCDLPREERRLYLDRAHKHVVRVGSLVSELFELSKLDALDAAPVREPFPLAELVQDTAIGLQVAADAKNIDLVIDVGSAAVDTVGDIGLVQRALENLIRNAIRFTQDGGRVEVGLAERGESAVVSVEDDGPGIAEEHLPRIFDRFYRVTAERDANSESSGLGLAIVKRIMDLHDTRIVAVSEVGAGTRFEFALPSCNRTESRPIEPDDRQTTTGLRTETSHTACSPTVLHTVVDTGRK